MTVSKNKTMPKWLEDFVQGISKKNDIVASNQHEKVAEVNIHDLPKIVWNDETFYVMFDEGGATVLNEFGNTVTTVKNVQTIEQVDQALNSKQIVTSNVKFDAFEEELNKISQYLSKEADDVNPGVSTNTTPVNPNDPNGNQNQQNQQPAQVNVNVENTDQQSSENNPATNPAPVPEVTPEPTTASVANEDEEFEEGYDLENDVEKVTAALNLREKVSELEAMIKRLTKKVEALSQQEYAHTNPGDVYDNKLRDSETEKMKQDNNDSEKFIDTQNSVDLTTMEGRISLIEKMHNELESIVNDEFSDSDDLTNPEDNTEDGLEELDFEDENDENKEDSEIGIELPEDSSEENLEELDFEDDETNPGLDPINNIDPDGEINKSVDSDPVVEDDKELNPETEVDKSPDEIVEDEEKKPVKPIKPVDKESSVSKGIIKLNSKDSKIFKNQICPHCGEKSLIKKASVGMMVGIYCKECPAEYAVNTETEEIFKKNN